MIRMYQRSRAVRVMTWVLFALIVLALGFILTELYVPRVNDSKLPVAMTEEQFVRGEYLVKIGNCAGCHTARGGEMMAGGRRVQTPFGSVVATNITSHPSAGIGAWSATDFYRALHEGRAADGRLLSPAFPYTNTTKVSRDDSDAMYAYLMKRIPPSDRKNEAGSLGFPYNTQLAIAVWRILFFTPDRPFQSAPRAGIARGEYLVDGLAHCSACHGARNALGGPIRGREYAGAMQPLQDWYASSLLDEREGAVTRWSTDEVVGLLRFGVNARATVQGPMADVVYKSTQYLSVEDARSMAEYLQSLPTVGAPKHELSATAAPKHDQSATAAPKHDQSATSSMKTRSTEQGASIYHMHCEGCHGERGEGKVGAYPALANNRAVTMARFDNLIRITLDGGFAPATPGNPAPYGMPPFYHRLSDAEIAAVLTHIRSSWGNAASAVTPLDMANYRNRMRSPE